MTFFRQVISRCQADTKGLSCTTFKLDLYFTSEKEELT